MENSVRLAIEALQLSGKDPEALRHVLLKFYRNRTLEILEHIEEQGAGKVVNFETIKIGGTD